MYSKNSELKITLLLVNIVLIQNVNIASLTLQDSILMSNDCE